jgi:predicted acetyltransferase
MTEVRTPLEEHRDQVANVIGVSLNLGRGFFEHRAPRIALGDFRAVFDGDRVLAVAGERRFTQRFGGRELDMCGIWGVGTLPERRGEGLATRAVSGLLGEARERGTSLSALYPAVLGPYRRLGYELAGTYTRQRVLFEDLPAGGGPLSVEAYDPARDLDAVRACYRRAVEPHNGPIDCEDDRWWPERIMGSTMPDERQRAVVVRGRDGELEAYASFAYEEEQGHLEIEFRLACRHLVATTAEGASALLGYFRGFRGVGRALQFPGAPADPLALLVEEQRLNPAWTFRWMLRLLDVRAALEGRGYPPVSGEALVAVEDPAFPDNRGPWRISAEEGKVRVAPAAGERVRPISIGALSSIYSGYLAPHDAVRLGLLDADDPAVPVLARLFAGTAPFMLDWF